MKTFDFIQMTISHNLKDPHLLEGDCLSPFLAIATQSLKGGACGALAGQDFFAKEIQ